MSKKRRPNVLIFIPHDLGDYLGCYGHTSVRSPNLDALANRGVYFSEYFTPAPECTPSRSSMMTGLYTHQNGLMGLSNFGWSLKSNATHLAEYLTQSGYASHLFGFQHETHESPHGLGYQHLHVQDDYRVQNVCQTLKEFLESKEAKDGPWFADAGFSHVHRVWPENTDFSEDDVEVPPFMPDRPIVRRDVARFHQSIFDMDCAVGEVLETLRKTGLEEDTLVIFTTDHGPAFPHAKATFYDPGIRIPLIMHWPGHLDGGVCYDELLSNIDFTPTLLELCDCPVPDVVGRSFSTLLSGDTYEEREAVYGALFYDVSYDPMHYVRTQTHKYIRSFATTEADAAGADERVLATHEAGKWIRVDDLDVMTAPTWQVMKTKCEVPPAEELYDLKADPLEMNDIAADEEAREILDGMRELLQSMMERTDSPLREGHVSPPPEQVEAAQSCRPGSERHRENVSRRWENIT
ncbi:MAG: sulfatase [Planctomycetes bacterium]|nr:sulfatase [Planctomycetota bacterium]